MIDAKTGLSPKDEYAMKKAELTKIFEPNISLPHLICTEFNNIDGLYTEPVKMMVPVERIVVSSGLKNWGDVEAFSDNRLEDFWDTFQSIKTNGFDERKARDLPKLIERGGIFEVTEGQRRIMTAKRLGIKEIPSQLTFCQPTVVSLPDEYFYEELFRRKEAGLWQGTISFTLDNEGQYRQGRAQIYDYVGLWALMPQMEAIKKVYEQVGASGKVKPII